MCFVRVLTTMSSIIETDSMAFRRPGSFTTMITIPVVMVVIGGLLFMSDSPLWWKKIFTTGFVGGCARYTVYAQNRWDPVGAAVRSEPRVEAPKIGGYAPNEIIVVDGWLHAEVAYPTNRPPWNSNIWFHLANQQGYVSYAGVRGTPTAKDPTGQATDGGQPAATPANCEGKIR